MSTSKAHISEKWLRKVKIAHVPVVDSDGNRNSRQYTEIGGALLIPVTDAHFFNTSRSSILRYIRDGKLVPYKNNGQIKQSNDSSKVFFDLYEYLNMD